MITGGGVSRVAQKYNLYLRPGTTLWSTRHPARNDHHGLYLLLGEMGTSWVITGGVSRVAQNYNIYLWSTRHPARNDHHGLYLLLSG